MIFADMGGGKYASVLSQHSFSQSLEPIAVQTSKRAYVTQTLVPAQLSPHLPTPDEPGPTSVIQAEIAPEIVKPLQPPAAPPPPVLAPPAEPLRLPAAIMPTPAPAPAALLPEIRDTTSNVKWIVIGGAAVLGLLGLVLLLK